MIFIRRADKVDAAPIARLVDALLSELSGSPSRYDERLAATSHLLKPGKSGLRLSRLRVAAAYWRYYSFGKRLHLCGRHVRRDHRAVRGSRAAFRKRGNEACRCRRDFGTETLLGTDRSWRVGTQPEILFECRICRAGPSAPFAALTLRPTSAAMSPIDVSRSQPPPLLPG